jgi:ubiquinone/menaquinone biosynthesis C-methylase UbiE
LAKASVHNSRQQKVQFLRAFGEDLPFREQRFDVVYSSFLFHELPREVRRAVLAESVRVLRPGGILVVLDSIQLGDDLRFDWALERFPADFHEPFYKDYTQDHMENWAASCPK